MASRRVCVIGAGPSGMSTLYHFSQLPVRPEIVCFEKQDTWGGLWNYTWRTGVDEHGEPCHAGMYKDLWTNGPKECAEYPDYTYEEHFGRPIPSFPPRAVVRDYLEGRWTRKPSYNLKNIIQFNTVVRSVIFEDTNNTFKVVTSNLKTGVMTENMFTHVIVATGIFSTPNVPSFPGIETFKGRITHSHDFRDGNEYRGQDVLVIGGSFSAEDVALHAIKCGANKVIISWKSKPLGHIWPEGIEERPLLKEVDGRVVIFKDGTSAEFDSIILCTGYRNQFPFLEGRLWIEPQTAYYPRGLYKGSLFLPVANNRLFYVGALVQLYTFTMLDSIAAWTCMYIMGCLPNEPKEKNEMQADSEIWHQKSLSVTDEYGLVDFQTALISSLINHIGISKDMCKAEPMFKEWLNNRKEGIATYRNNTFRSIYTGNLAPRQIPFMEVLDDSLEGFLNAFPLSKVA